MLIVSVPPPQYDQKFEAHAVAPGVSEALTIPPFCTIVAVKFFHVVGAIVIGDLDADAGVRETRTPRADDALRGGVVGRARQAATSAGIVRIHRDEDDALKHWIAVIDGGELRAERIPAGRYVSVLDVGAVSPSALHVEARSSSAGHVTGLLTVDPAP